MSLVNRYKGKIAPKFELAVRKVVFAVFLVPAIASIFFGGFVLGEVLKKPDRDLDMMPFGFSGNIGISSGAMTINGLQKEYLVTTPVQVSVSITDPIFDCGDLYITIYDVSKNPKEVVTQSGYFGQCYEKNNLMMPIDDKFSETLKTPGQYELVSEINDASYQNSLTASERFIVK